ncbi:ABC transporter ATP-binding protein [Halobacteria archaeon AArc-m2/3/4]|uniref:ABC transporter ATP-binding protein n=1 Tax=Natronoglomus mannanivorans TaxID=2979990 RepID=A0ABT2QEW2_9EURY|nr:ABC transporter ATP-binding protein [Halobacteria archaeon AArc-m2/3/4]
MTTSQSTSLDDPTAADPVVEIRNATVRFGMERGESRVLDDVSLDLERNEIFGVVGESGSGKSMLASAMLDAVVEPGILDGSITYRPEAGDPIDVLGLTTNELRTFRWEEIAMVFQGAMSSFNPVRKIDTHFVETLSAHDYDVDEGMERARGLISDLYMDPERVLDSYPHELSGGMKQRTLIALSLILEPDVLVMDEPTAALDLLMQRSIVSLIEEIKEEYDLTILFITHDLPLVADLADRIAVMYAFEFVELGPTEEILQHASHPYTRLLLKSTPNLASPIEAMRPIEGSAPDPVNVPSGCSFHLRCPLADEQCVEVDPEAYSVSDSSVSVTGSDSDSDLSPDSDATSIPNSDAGDHVANCHYWEDAPETIPMTEEWDVEGIDAIDSAPGPSRTADPLVSMEDVEVHFETEGSFLDFFSEPDTVQAVDGISLDIYENDVVVLVGESGCGKTTFGKTAVGLQEPTDGAVKYRGQDIWDLKRSGGDGTMSFDTVRRALQIVHQDPGSALNAHRRVGTSLEVPLKRWNPELDGNDRKSRIVSLLEHVGMSPAEDYIDRYPHQLSGGEQQRVALIRAMLMNPDLILADEPVSALDVSLRVEMMDLMIELQEQFDTSYLFVSHDLSNARYIAEKTGGRIGVVYLGELVEIGRPEEIIHDPQHPYTQALRWATPEPDFEGGGMGGESPIREIDVPDPTDPPSGCRYHTRCPEAREVCTREHPEPNEASAAAYHEAACFRTDDHHEYWNSPSITDGGD